MPYRDARIRRRADLPSQVVLSPLISSRLAGNIGALAQLLESGSLRTDVQASRTRLDLVLVRFAGRKVADHSGAANNGPRGVAFAKNAFDHERDVRALVRMFGQHQSAGIKVLSEGKWSDFAQAQGFSRDIHTRLLFFRIHLRRIDG